MITAVLLTASMASCPLDRIAVEGLPYFARFGSAVRFWPEGLIVGAGLDEVEPLIPVGRIHFMEPSPAGWDSVLQLADPKPESNSGFGLHLACEADVVLVGATLSDALGFNSGTVVSYTRLGNEWVAERLIPSDGADARFFSRPTVDGGCAVIGAYGTPAGPIDAVGRLYEFRREGDQWIETAVIDPPPEHVEEGMLFGERVALRDDVLVVGAFEASVDGVPYAGRAYIYERARDGDWELVASLDSGAPGFFDLFGSDVATDGERVVIGMQQRPNGQGGEAFVYIRDADGEWVLEHHLDPGIDEYDAAFGFAVAVQDDLVAVGMPLVDLGSKDRGRVYLYDVNDIENPRTFEPPAHVKTSSFGTALDFDTYSGQRRLAVGAWADDVTDLVRGAAYVIDLDDCAQCPEDFDHSGAVGFSDLLQLLQSWDAQGPTDLDDDGVTGPLDLTQLIESWGPCE